jgi:hypothetical protein
MRSHVPVSQPVLLAWMRARARAPRVVAVTTLLVLCIAGLRSIAEGPPRRTARAAARSCMPDVRAEGAAETFVRSWLSWRAGEPDPVAQRMVPRDVDVSAAPPAGGRQLVDWTTPVADECLPQSVRRVVVAAAAGSPPTWHVAVAVTTTRDGARISGAPAIVGPPIASQPGLSRPEVEIDDPSLEAVVARVIRHYLQRDASDLAADLSPGTRVSLPDGPLALAGIDAVTWADPGRVAAAAVTARTARGTRLPLRYELALTRRGGRWLVSGIDTTPHDPEVGR